MRWFVHFFSYVIICIVFAACEAIYTLDSDSMNNTILKGQKVKIRPQKIYSIGDVVLVEYMDKVFSRSMKIALRVVGKSGDKVGVHAGNVYVNNKRIDFKDSAILNFKIFTNDTNNFRIIRGYGLQESYVDGCVLATLSDMIMLKRGNVVDSFSRCTFGTEVKQNIVNGSSKYGWNLDNFGPVVIAKADDELQLNEVEFYYGKRSYERRISGICYFLIADNFYQSMDSRTIGILEGEHILGKIIQ